MNDFIEFLNKENSKYFNLLIEAGGNTGAQKGSSNFVKTWNNLSRDPNFVKIQEIFY